MNNKPVEALPEVAGDLLAAIGHYQSWQRDGRDHFLQKYEETVSWIAQNPDLFPLRFGAVRRVILKQSYYVVYFLEEPTRCLMLAVLDGRDNPTKRVRLIRQRHRSR